MRALTLTLLLAACGGETGFQTNPNTNAVEDGNGKLTFYPGPLTWTDLTPGIATSAYFKLISEGEYDLQVYNVDVIDSAQGQFYIDDVEAFSLVPGEDREFAVVCTLAGSEMAVGELRVKTNDPDQLDLRVALTATPEGWTGDTGGDSGLSGMDSGGS